MRKQDLKTLIALTVLAMTSCLSLAGAAQPNSGTPKKVMSRKTLY